MEVRLSRFIPIPLQIECLQYKGTRPSAELIDFVQCAARTDSGSLAKMRSFRGDVNGRDAQGYTALVKAIETNNFAAVDQLLEWSRVDVLNIVRGQSPVVWAVLAQGDDERVLKVLYQRRAVDINMCSDNATFNR